jgi:uncharacterized protein YjbJ (UPF0337 family)
LLDLGGKTTRTESSDLQKEIKGAAKQVVGKAFGDAKLESDRTDMIEGKLQNAIGGLK